MKKIKGFKKFGAVAAAVCATAGIVGGMSVPTLADSVTGADNLSAQTPIKKSGGFYKYLLMRDTAQTPDAVMTFNIVPGTAAAAVAGTNDTWKYNNVSYDTKAKAEAAATAAGGQTSDVVYVPGTDGTPAVKAGITGAVDIYRYNNTNYASEAAAIADGATAAEIKHITSNPSVYDAIFTDRQTTSTDETTVISEDRLDSGKYTPAAADLDGDLDHKYAKSEVKVDFSGVTFTAPGVYRYVITEDTVTSQANITKDPGTYYLDVYVQNDESASGKLKIDGYVFHKSDDTTKKTPGGRYANGNEITQGTWYEYTFRGDDARTEAYATLDEAKEAAKKDGRTDAELASEPGTIIVEKTGNSAKDSKTDGLLNIMDTADLTVKKEIEGNMADKTQTFPFKVVIDEDGAGSKTGVANTYTWEVYDSNIKEYMYAGTRYATQAEAVAAATTAGGSAADVKEVDYLKTGAGDSGTISPTAGAEITYNLKGGEYVKVTGLPTAATYEVSETKNDDYVLSKIEGADESDVTKADKQATGDMNEDTNIIYTNVKDVITPTGIVTQYLPFFIMAGAGVGVAVFFAVRKKRSEAED